MVEEFGGCMGLRTIVSLRMTTHGGGVRGLYGLAAGCDFGVTQRW
jgi:hypothetical protein